MRGLGTMVVLLAVGLFAGTAVAEDKYGFDEPERPEPYCEPDAKVVCQNVVDQIKGCLAEAKTLDEARTCADDVF